jgi:hypothetical protein
MAAMKARVFESDQALKDLVGQRYNYFVVYAEDTKLKPFYTERAAQKYADRLNRS